MKQLLKYSSYGSKLGPFIFEINVQMDREFTDNDRRAADKCADELINALHKETIANDEESIKFREETKQTLLGLFETPIFSKEIPNEYYGENSPYSFNFPWFLVTTSVGPIKIGWRKRVISIDWSQTIVPKTAEELFKEEDTTKDGKLIHAWTYAKAKEYLKVIINGI